MHIYGNILYSYHQIVISGVKRSVMMYYICIMNYMFWFFSHNEKRWKLSLKIGVLTYKSLPFFCHFTIFLSYYKTMISSHIILIIFGKKCVIIANYANNMKIEELYHSVNISVLHDEYEFNYWRMELHI